MTPSKIRATPIAETKNPTIIPYIFTAPFYFAREIELGVMTQTAGAFGHVASALNFFVNYYTYLAGFKSVVDRLNSFDVAIHIPAGICVMVVPAKPYIPISTLRTAVTYPAVPGTYLDDDICRALVDAISATSSTNSIARKCGHSGCPVGSSSALR